MHLFCISFVALFLFRNDSFLHHLPPDVKKEFVDDESIVRAKLKILRKMIEDRFPVCIPSGMFKILHQHNLYIKQL